MDEQLSEEAKPKITRSRARHIRRKRLLSARRAAENDSSGGLNIEAEGSNDSKSPENRKLTDSLSKSKARRLRKKNKSENNKNSGKVVENRGDIIESPSRVSENIQKTVNEEIIASSTKSKREQEILPLRNDIIECNSFMREPSTVKITASEHELFENEKNLKITENSRSSFDCTARRISEDYESGVITIDDTEDTSLSFIINEDSNYRIIDDIETEDFESGVISDRIEDVSFLRGSIISSINNERRYETNDEVKLSNLMRDTTITAVKVSTTSKPLEPKMSSQEKTREQVKAEREAKKAAKAAAKSKGKVSKPETVENEVSTKSNLEVAKKKVNEAKIDLVDGEILPMTSKLTISGTSKKKPEVAIAPGVVEVKNEAKSKSELRAERRAKQEAQRATKQGQQVPEKIKPRETMKQEGTKATIMPKKCEDSAKKIVKRTVVKENAHEVNLFKHLYHEREQAMISVPTVNSNIHPAIVRLGVQYANKVIVGSNARCVALLAAVKQLIQDFERPSQADFTRGLEASLQESSAYLHHCRPLAVSMQNALRHLKWQMAQLSATTSDKDAKTKLGNAIDTYIQEQIQLADKAISITIQTKISNGDVILTYGYSSLIYKILCDAHDAGRQFRVVVVDGRPWLEGREQLRRLAKHGLECSYVLINALSFIMPEVSKVFLGAHAILANGAVMSRVGTAQVALMAKSFNVPVLVACETHKTCERVQTDSIVYNEIADADELAQNLMGSSKKTSLINWRTKKSLNLLNITYDVTPADLVTAVVTELAILPCTSVPVILRIKPSEI